jgi:hypothetical protein
MKLFFLSMLSRFVGYIMSRLTAAFQRYVFGPT